jgi:hypothetical protein
MLRTDSRRWKKLSILTIRRDRRGSSNSSKISGDKRSKRVKSSLRKVGSKC